MNLEIHNKLFVVGGATSGLGKAVAEALLKEGANIIAIARGERKLKELKNEFPEKVETVCKDIMHPESAGKIAATLGERQLHGILVNAGGPPAMQATETTLKDWDEAYRTVFRWKVDFTQTMLQQMMKKEYGRIVYIESSAVKQPIENLVLSTSMRLAVVGYVKTLSQEVARKGITLNILAPGSHATSAINRLINKQIEQTGKNSEEVKKQLVNQIGVGFLGEAADLASLAVWLLSPHSRFITGQTISVDGEQLKELWDRNK